MTFFAKPFTSSAVKEIIPLCVQVDADFFDGFQDDFDEDDMKKAS